MHFTKLLILLFVGISLSAQEKGVWTNQDCRSKINRLPKSRANTKVKSMVPSSLLWEAMPFVPSFIKGDYQETAGTKKTKLLWMANSREIKSYSTPVQVAVNITHLSLRHFTPVKKIPNSGSDQKAPGT